MREKFANITDTEAFGYSMRDFLDRFKDDGKADAFLASTAAYLAQQHQLPVPLWARGTARALEKPWFAAKSHNLRMVLLQESPAAFRVRNLFVSANALHRA